MLSNELKNITTVLVQLCTNVELFLIKKESFDEGENWIDLPVSKNWPTGIYVIQMNTTSGSLAAKWLK